MHVAFMLVPAALPPNVGGIPDKRLRTQGGAASHGQTHMELAGSVLHPTSSSVLLKAIPAGAG
eukprot:4425849-Pyramimonas_sp.AAC.1